MCVNLCKRTRTIEKFIGSFVNDDVILGIFKSNHVKMEFIRPKGQVFVIIAAGAL